MLVPQLQAPPAGSREIQWERSFYLNLALHSYTYQLTIVIGRRPPGGQLEILSKVQGKAEEAQWGVVVQCAVVSAVSIAFHRISMSVEAVAFPPHKKKNVPTHTHM